jgi:integrase
LATIRKRGKTWQVQVRKKGYALQTKSFTYKADAEAWARSIERDMERGEFVSTGEAQKITLGEIIDRYIREVTPSKRSSFKEEQRLNYIKKKLGKHNFAALQSKDIAKFRDDRLADGKAPATVVRELNNLSHVIDTAINEWSIWIPTNPVKTVRRPAVSNARDRRLKPGEEEALLAACGSARSTQLQPIVKLALETAMRLGELLDLRWEHIDLTRRVAHLPATKNGESRDVPLSSTAIAVLQGLKAKLKLDQDDEEKVMRLEKKRAQERVFYQWLRVDSFEHTWRRAIDRAKEQYFAQCKQAGLSADTTFLGDLRFHDLRHEATSRLSEKVPNLIELASITGHKDLQMLKRYYHPRAEDLARKLG